MNKLLIILILSICFQEIFVLELVTNGNFNFNACFNSVCLFTDPYSVSGWQPDPDLEIGKAQIYSDHIDDGWVVELAGHQKTCIKQTLRNVCPGTYQLKFNWTARRGVKYDVCKLAVFVNGQQKRSYIPQTYLVQENRFAVKVNTSSVELRFCSAGPNISVGPILKSISFQAAKPQQISEQTIIIGKDTQNLIINGKFIDSKCGSNFCIYDGKYDSNGVKGWDYPTQIEIGYAEIYSAQIQGGRVIELAANKMICISQTLRNVESALYDLRFEWACRKGIPFDNCKITVKVDETLLPTYAPRDYFVHTDIVKVNVNSQMDLKIQFCGAGPFDSSVSAILKSIGMFKAGEPIMKNLVNNFDFQSNDCKFQTYVWDNSSSSDFLKGWSVKGQAFLGSEQMLLHQEQTTPCEMVKLIGGQKASCIHQKVSFLQPGKYTFTVLWTCKINDTQLCQLDFKINSTSYLLNRTPSQDQIFQQDSNSFSIVNQGDSAQLQLCALQTNTKPVIKAVQIVKNYNANPVKKVEIPVTNQFKFSSNQLVHYTKNVEMEDYGTVKVSFKLLNVNLPPDNHVIVQWNGKEKQRFKEQSFGKTVQTKFSSQQGKHQISVHLQSFTEQKYQIAIENFDVNFEY